MLFLHIYRSLLRDTSKPCLLHLQKVHLNLNFRSYVFSYHSTVHNEREECHEAVQTDATKKTSFQEGEASS